jgi:hypothetical protein
MLLNLTTKMKDATVQSSLGLREGGSHFANCGGMIELCKITQTRD